MTASRTIIDQVKDDSSSLICLRDSASVKSVWTSTTDRSSLFSREFVFDNELLASKVYQGQIRSLMRRALRKDRTANQLLPLSAAQVASRESKEERQKSTAIEQQIQRDRLSGRSHIKVLLLGPENNKQSIVLDMLLLSQIKSYSAEMRESYRRIIQFSCLPDILNPIFLELERMGYEWVYYSPMDLERVSQWLTSVENAKMDAVPQDVVTAIASLWQNQVFRTCYETCKHHICRRAPA